MAVPDEFLSRRALLQGSAAAAVLASAGAPLSAPPPPSARGPVVAGPGNVRVSRDGFTMHAEPSLAANPRDRRNLLGACMVWQAGKRGLASYASFDGGQTWRSNGLLPGVVPGYDGDVTVAFDGQGTGFVSGWVGSRRAKQRGRVHVWRTEDGGRHFLPPVTAATGLVDHPWLAADRWARSSPGVLYLAGDYFGRGGLVFTCSTDGGRTFGTLRFLDPRSGSRGGRAPMVAAGPGGLAAVAYFVEMADASQLIKVVSSADYGRTFASPVLVTRVIPPPIVSGVNTTTGGPAIAAHPDGSGLCVAVATVNVAAQMSELRLFSSQDKGHSWGRPVTVARSGQVVYFQPQLAADDAGRVALSVFALPVATGRVEVLMFVSERGGRRFGRPVRVTSRAFDPHAGTQQGWIGDYQGLAATAGAFHPFWNDTRTGHMQVFTATV